MTVRRESRDGNQHPEEASENSDRDRALLGLRAFVILVSAAGTGCVVGGLTFMAERHLALAFLAGLGGFATALEVINRSVG
jgi:hypothetical protein